MKRMLLIIFVLFIVAQFITIKKEIDSKEPILIYFSGENCSVCKVLKPKIEEEVRINFQKMKIF